MSHPKYEYNGRIVPSVTTILGVVDKNLVRWAYNLGKSGVVLEDYQKYVNNVGTLTHYFIETYLKGSKSAPTSVGVPYFPSITRRSWYAASWA